MSSSSNNEIEDIHSSVLKKLYFPTFNKYILVFFILDYSCGYNAILPHLYIILMPLYHIIYHNTPK